MHTHKLAKRLASNHRGVYLAALAAFGCAGDHPSASQYSVSELRITPDSATIAPSQTITFKAIGLTTGGDTVPVPAAWSAGGGTIDADGRFVADTIEGRFAVVARPSETDRPEAASQGELHAFVAIKAAAAAAPAVLFTEGFEDNNLGARGWYDHGAMTTTTAERAVGSRALEARFTAGATNTSWGGARHQFTPSESVYLRYRVKYSSNWQGSGQPYQPHEFNLLTTADSRWTGPAFTHLTLYVEHNVRAGSLAPLLSWQDGANIDQSRVGQNLIGVTERRAVSGCNGDPTGPGISAGCYPSGGLYRNGATLTPAGTPLARNTWQQVEMYVRLNTILNGIGQADGILQYWLDGALQVDRRNLVFRTGAHPTMKFDQLLFAPYIGDGSPVTQTAWYDDLEVATGRLQGPPPPTPVASVSLNPTSVTRNVGQTVQLTATPRDAGGNALTGRSVSWTTSQAAIASVSGTGLVTARGVGSATITATSEGQAGTAVMTVTSGTVPVATVSVSPASLALVQGQTASLTATPRDAGGTALTGRSITWSSSATGVATVSGSGVVTGQGAGTATITASSEGKSGSASVVVTRPPVASITVSPTSFTLGVGQTQQLAATARDAAGNALSGRVITWATTVPSVASVSATGLVAGLATGSATIRATSEGVSSTAVATVTGGGSGPAPNIVGPASFETGWDGWKSVSGGNPSGTVSRTTERARLGSWSAKRSINAGGDSDAALWHQLSPTRNEVYFFTWVYFNNFPSTSAYKTFAFWTANPGTRQLIIYLESGGIHAWSPQRGDIRSSAWNVPITTGTWHSIEIQYQKSQNRVRIWWDGQLRGDWVSAGSGDGQNIWRFELGGLVNSPSNTTSHYWDGAALSTQRIGQ